MTTKYRTNAKLPPSLLPDTDLPSLQKIDEDPVDATEGGGDHNAIRTRNSADVSTPMIDDSIEWWLAIDDEVRAANPEYFGGADQLPQLNACSSERTSDGSDCLSPTFTNIENNHTLTAQLCSKIDCNILLSGEVNDGDLMSIPHYSSNIVDGWVSLESGAEGNSVIVDALRTACEVVASADRSVETMTLINTYNGKVRASCRLYEDWLLEEHSDATVSCAVRDLARTSLNWRYRSVGRASRSCFPLVIFTLHHSAHALSLSPQNVSAHMSGDLEWRDGADTPCSIIVIDGNEVLAVEPDSEDKSNLGAWLRVSIKCTNGISEHGLLNPLSALISSQWNHAN